MDTCQVCHPSGPTPTVLIVHGDALVEEALQGLLQSVGWSLTVLNSLNEFLACPKSRGPCCLLAELHPHSLMDAKVQDLLGHPELPVVFVSGQNDVRAAVHVMKQGALEVVLMPLTEDTLLSAVRNALDCSRAALEQLAQLQVLEARYSSLSTREREVMGLVVSGRMNKHVSCELGISEITVKAHRGRMMRKMRARSLAELVTMASRLHSKLLGQPWGFRFSEQSWITR